jgi:hypothetical protein
MAGAGYKLFNTGDVLTAAQVNTYLNEQTVMVFASSAARTSALSGVLAEGMVSYLQDTNAVEVYNGTSWVNVGNAGDITEVQAGVGISIASGTGPIPVITNSSTDLITTAGDILYGTAADTMARLGIGTAGQVLKVNSGATAPEWGAAAGAASFVGVSAYKNTGNQTLSNNTGTAITFPDEDYDTDGFHSTVTNTSRFTIPSGKNGYYLMTASISYDPNASGNRVLYFYKNGSALQYSEQGGGTTTFATVLSGSIVANLAVGDYIEMFGWQTSGGNLAVLASPENTRMQLTYLGA